MFLLAKYGVQTTFTFPMVKRGVVDLAVTADWTPATGDTKVSKDGGTVANSTNNPAIVAGTGSVDWSLVLTATELTAAVIDVQIVDSATKAVEDQYLKIYTYGHASAKIPLDLSAELHNRLPTALISGRMDSSVGAVAANAISDAAVSSDMDHYGAKIEMVKDGSSADRYVVSFLKNGIRVTSGVTDPQIQVIKISDGSDLIALTSLTEIGSTHRFKKDEATNKMVAGQAYTVVATATIDGLTRSAERTLGVSVA